MGIWLWSILGRVISQKDEHDICLPLIVHHRLNLSLALQLFTYPPIYHRSMLVYTNNTYCANKYALAKLQGKI